MRAQAFENLLIEMEKEIDKLSNIIQWHINLSTLKNLSTKSKILRNRSDKGESVFREMLTK